MTKSGGKSLTVRVAETIKNDIIRRRMKPGDKIPSESLLMEQFHVSRTTVREAMKLLKAENIVVIRRGDGTYVSDKTGVKDDPLGLLFSGATELLEELLEARLLIEPRLIDLAVLRATPADIARLQNILEQMEQVSQQNEEYMALDIEFHTHIARCAHNNVLEKIVPVICDSIHKGYPETMHALGTFERAQTSHRNIFRSIVDKDTFLAEYEVERHIRQTLDDVKNKKLRKREEMT